MNGVSATQILGKAKDLLLAGDHGWGQGELAFDQHENSVDPFSAEACSFCAEGAMIRSAYELGEYKQGDGVSDPSLVYLSAHLHLMMAAQETDDLFDQDDYLTDWNDHPNRTFEEVVKAFDRATELIMETVKK